jgi:hypothetical protein
MRETYQQLKDMIAAAEDDIEKAASGNKAAGTRVRKLMQDVKSQAQQLRQQVLDNRSES